MLSPHPENSREASKSPLIWFVNRTITDEFREILTTEVLNSIDTADVDLRQRLLQAVSRHIDGQIDPHDLSSKLPDHKEGLIDATRGNDQSFGLFLSIWFQSKEMLRSLVDAFLDTKGYQPVSSFEAVMQCPPRGFWSTAEMRSLLNSFLSWQPKCNRYEIAVMLYCRSGYAYLPKYLKKDVDTTSSQQVADADDGQLCDETSLDDNNTSFEITRFGSWLNELNDLPGDAPEWDEVDEFVNQLLLISESKQQDRHLLAQIQGRINAFHSIPGRLLEYFGFSEARTWEVPSGSIKNGSELVEVLGRLLVSLGEYDRSQATYPTSLDEARQFREELARLEDTIVHDYRYVATAFSTRDTHQSVETQGVYVLPLAKQSLIQTSQHIAEPGLQPTIASDESAGREVVAISDSPSTCFRFPTQTDYAIQIVTYLANSNGSQRQTAFQVAEGTGIPHAFLSKIVSQLSAAGIVIATRGAGGGLTLARPASEVFLLEVIEATTELTELVACDSSCPRFGKCAFFEVLDEAHDMLVDRFATASFG